MYQPVILFIALRYIHQRSIYFFDRFVSWFSTIGITLGVLSLVIILSVMNGFEQKLTLNTLSFIPQSILTGKNNTINPKKISLKVFPLKGVYRITSLTTSDIILQSKNNISVGVMLGINPHEAEPITPFLINAQKKLLQPNTYNIILGDRHAAALGVKKGDQLRIIVPRMNDFKTINDIKKKNIFNVIGIYKTNSEIDNYQVFVNQKDASNIMYYPIGNITGWRLWLENPLTVDQISKQHLPRELIWKDWRILKGELFNAVRMEKNIMSLLLSVIIAVAGFNIITSLSLLIMEKKSEIAIFQIQGLTRKKIIILFMIQGASKGIIGTIIGIVVGIFFVYQIKYCSPFIHFFLDEVNLPVQIDIFQITMIGIISIIISVLSTLYPAFRAATVQTTEALRYE